MPAAATLMATLMDQGNAAAARRDWPAALDRYARATQEAPDQAAAWIALAKAHDLGGSHRASRDAAMRAVGLAPAGFAHGLALARLLRRHHETRALDTVAGALLARRDQATPEQLVELADLCGHQDLHKLAEALLQDALARDPGQAPAHYLMGATRMFQGRMEEAAAAFEAAIARVPHFAHAHWRLSELRRHLPPGDAPRRIDRLRAQLARVADGSEHAIHFLFALHAELHDLGDHDAAWDALERGCRAKRTKLDYDPATDRALFAALRSRCDARFVAGPPGYDPGPDAPAPVFVVGLFRSGTTVVERMLAGHHDVAAGGETLAFTTSLRLAADQRGRELLDLPLLARVDTLDHDALGADFMRASAWRAGDRRAWTEKLPANFLNLGLIARALPRARFVHVHRDPVDVCFSNLRVLYGALCPYSYDQAELAAYHHGYADLMTHWRAVLAERLLDVAHANLVAAPERELRRIAAHCGLGFDPAMLRLDREGDTVSTFSATQVRGGLRAGGGDWRPYRARLAPLLEALAPE